MELYKQDEANIGEETPKLDLEEGNRELFLYCPKLYVAETSLAARWFPLGQNVPTISLHAFHSNSNKLGLWSKLANPWPKTTLFYPLEVSERRVCLGVCVFFPIFKQQQLELVDALKTSML